MIGLVRHMRGARDHRWSQRHISDYLDGELAARQQRRLEAHAGLCPDCGRLRRSLTVLVWELRQLGSTRPTGPTVAGRVIERLRSEPLRSDSGGPAAPAMSVAHRTLVIGAGAAWQATADGRPASASSMARVSAPVAKSDEARLVERAQAGDRLAFEELVRRHAERLYAVVLRFVADAEEAEEVTQETFLRAWRSIEKFEHRSQFFTWLYRIGINEAKRRAARRPPAGRITSIEDSPIEDAPDWSEAPEFRAERGHMRGVLEDAVRALPIEYRAALILRDVEGLSTEEAADVMELGEAAFKSRLHRARLAVRRAVDEYYLESDR